MFRGCRRELGMRIDCQASQNGSTQLARGRRRGFGGVTSWDPTARTLLARRETHTDTPRLWDHSLPTLSACTIWQATLRSSLRTAGTATTTERPQTGMRGMQIAHSDKKLELCAAAVGTMEVLTSVMQHVIGKVAPVSDSNARYWASAWSGRLINEAPPDRPLPWDSTQSRGCTTNLLGSRRRGPCAAFIRSLHSIDIAGRRRYAPRPNLVICPRALSVSNKSSNRTAPSALAGGGR